jgi:predicted secreted protein
MNKTALCALLLALPCLAWADAAPQFNVVNLDASVSRQIDNDMAQATLFVELTDVDSSKLAEKINQTIAAAQKTLKQYPTVQSAGTGYSSYPVYNQKNNLLQSWRSRGELRVSSKDFAALSQLIAQLQQLKNPQSNGIALQLADIRYEVSDQSRKLAEDALIEEGIKAFRQRAQIIQRTMGGNAWKTMQMNVQTQSHYPQPRQMLNKAYMAAEAAPAPVDAGESRLVVNVNGSIQVGE